MKVPTDNPKLASTTLYDIEEGWDFGMAQVSTDGGATWKSLQLTDATSDHDPDAEARITDQLPGLTGSSGSWKTETADLSAYAGQDVLIDFRYMTDAGLRARRLLGAQRPGRRHHASDRLARRLEVDHRDPPGPGRRLHRAAGSASAARRTAPTARS